MSVIQFGCPFCGAVAEVDAGRAGQETSCPACASVLVVPQAEPAAPDAQVLGAADDPAAEGAATTKPGSRRNKPKLWQTSPRAGGPGDAASPPLPELPQPLVVDPISADTSPLAAPAPRENPVVDLSSESPLDRDAPRGGGSYGRRANSVAREERQRRRTISNAIMLIGSMVVLFAVMAVLMYMTRK